MVIDLFGNPRSALLARLSGAPVRVGPDRRGRGRFYTHRVPDDGRPKSAVAFHQQSLAAAGIPATSSTTEIFLTEAERNAARDLLARTMGFAGEGRTVVAIHPGATWPAKHWPAERFGGLAARIREAGHAVILLGGPRDGDTLAAVQRAAGCDVPALLALPLRTLAAVTADCAAFVGNDAGPMHISAAVGTPTIGLFGPGEENIWFPYDRAAGHAALRVDVPCHPCHLDVCTREGEGHMECMRLLTVERVASAVLAAARRV
jgi:ADP-heptose:LPS heptosyltransferase